MKRRSVLAGVSGGAIALVGCLDTASTDSTDENGDDTDEDDEGTGDGGSEAECDLERRSENGRADPIETTVEVQMEGTSERDVDERCVKEAAGAAFAKLDERLELDLERADWIYPGWRYDFDQHYASIEVQSVQNRERDGYPVCPGSEFDYDDALEGIPNEVTVSLEVDDERHDCTHEITLRQGTLHLD